MPKAIIFDFDGVLVDSEKYWPAATRTIFEAHATLPWTDDDCRSMTGLGLRQCHERFSKDFGMAMTLAEYERHLLDHVAGMYDTDVDLMPGTRTLLDRLNDAGTPKAIASSNVGDVIRRTTRRLGIDDHFLTICSSDDVGEFTKPHPDVYLLAAKHLGMTPASCIAIEDSNAGLTAAKRAGMHCIALRTEHNAHQNLDAADTHITHFDELSDELLTLLLG